MKILIFALALGAAQAQTYYSVPAADAPELARRGTFGVGVRTLDLVHKDQIDILKFDAATGKAPLYDRPLKVELWYPATIPAGVEEKTTYASRNPGNTNPPGGFEFAGKALRGAAPLADRKFPLVVVSHGYPGNRVFLTYLTENLASKGYVVAAIDHTDSVLGEIRGFQSTLLNRSADQWFVIETVGAMPNVDAANVAIVGYSMGGYGALTSAGAGISKASPLAKFVPGGYLADWFADSPKFQAVRRTALKAVVAIAPWGEQPPYAAWDAPALAAIQIPTLFIAGDHDDVADYENGIRPAFEKAVQSDRCMLVYENARHNTGGNPAPPSLESPGMASFFDEPVWRKERINAVNNHFITAFLGWTLKGETAKRDYLHVAPAKSGDGKWAAQQATDEPAYSTGKDAAGNLFWKGFQRRSALGLEMRCLEATGKPGLK
jgi:predicted dienelactone hydrolase